MRYLVLFLHVVLLYSVCHCCHLSRTGEICRSTPNCGSGLECVNGRCTIRCLKLGTVCNGDTWACCKGKKCQPVVGSKLSMCLTEEKCSNDSSCPAGLKCLVELQKCGVCKSDFETGCTDNSQCCSNHCRYSIFGRPRFCVTLTRPNCLPNLSLCNSNEECCRGFCSSEYRVPHLSHAGICL